MKSKIKYQVIECTTINTLNQVVEKFLKLGWKCQGGVCACKSNLTNFVYFYQAMTKKQISQIKGQK